MKRLVWYAMLSMLLISVIGSFLFAFGEQGNGIFISSGSCWKECYEPFMSLEHMHVPTIVLDYQDAIDIADVVLNNFYPEPTYYTPHLRSVDYDKEEGIWVVGYVLVPPYGNPETWLGNEFYVAIAESDGRIVGTMVSE